MVHRVNIVPDNREIRNYLSTTTYLPTYLSTSGRHVAGVSLLGVRDFCNILRLLDSAQITSPTIVWHVLSISHQFQLSQFDMISAQKVSSVVD